MRVLLLSVLAAAACGGPAKKPTGPTFTKGAKVKIVDGGQIYDALNTTDCVKWPTPEIKHRAGRDGWNGWDPDSGIEGEVVASLAHCDGKTQVILLEVAGYVVPVTSKGIEETVLENGGPGGMIVGGIYGGDPYGGDPYGGDPYGGYDEYDEYEEDYGWDTYGTSFSIGDQVQLIYGSSVYSTMNLDDCLTWPSEDAKQRGGEDAWGSWWPSDGDIVTVIGTSLNCNDEYETVLIVDDGGEIVATPSSNVQPY